MRYCMESLPPLAARFLTVPCPQRCCLRLAASCNFSSPPQLYSPLPLILCNYSYQQSFRAIELDHFMKEKVLESRQGNCKQVTPSCRDFFWNETAHRQILVVCSSSQGCCRWHPLAVVCKGVNTITRHEAIFSSGCIARASTHLSNCIYCQSYLLLQALVLKPLFSGVRQIRQILCSLRLISGLRPLFFASIRL
jgi:hypothetical protein